MKAIVLGSTGLVGGEVTRQLIMEDSIEEITLLNRRKGDFTHPKIKEIIIDFNHIADNPQIQEIQADFLFCCLGTTIKKAQNKLAFRRVDHDIPLEFAQLFSQKNHKAFAVVSAAGSNPQSPFFYNQVKGELEAGLKSLPLNRLVIVRPSLLLGHREEKRPFEKLSQKVAPYLSPFLPKKYRPVKASLVAKTMVELALGRASDSPIDNEVIVQ